MCVTLFEFVYLLTHSKCIVGQVMYTNALKVNRMYRYESLTGRWKFHVYPEKKSKVDIGRALHRMTVECRVGAKSENM